MKIVPAEHLIKEIKAMSSQMNAEIKQLQRDRKALEYVIDVLKSFSRKEMQGEFPVDSVLSRAQRISGPGGP